MTHHQDSDVSTRHLLVDASPHTLPLPSLLQTYQLRLFYGDLHNHTGYSDGLGRPEDALRQMRARDCTSPRSLTMVSSSIVTRRCRMRVNGPPPAAGGSLTGDEFLAIRGFEWSSPHQGHSNVWCSAEYTGYRDTGDHTMQAFYAWLAKAEPIPAAASWPPSTTPAVSWHASMAGPSCRRSTTGSWRWNASIVAMIMVMLFVRA